MSENTEVSVMVKITPELHQKAMKLAESGGMKRQKLYELAFQFAFASSHFVNVVSQDDVLTRLLAGV